MPPTLMFDVIYNAGNIQLDVVALLLGDYNRNGTVDAADYVMYREAQTTGAIWLENRDPLNVGVVGDADYNSWRANFGSSLPGSGSALGQSTEVPEPVAALLALWAAVGYLGLGSRGVKFAS